MKNLTPQYKKVIEYCVNEILKLRKRPLVVAITGESGSGKSTFCLEIIHSLDEKNIAYSFVNKDDFLVPRQTRDEQKVMFYETGEFRGKSYWEVFENWYFVDEFNRVLDELLSGKTATFYPYDHSTGKTSETIKKINPQKLIIIENPLFTQRADFVIRFDVRRDEILNRKTKRDLYTREPKEIVEMHNATQGAFWDRAKPQNVDIIIDNNDYTNPRIIKG